MTRFAPLLLGSFLLAQAFAQTGGSWVPLSSPASPLARERHAMVYDVARNESVLFGGLNGAYRNDTWVLTQTGWVQRSPATVPGVRVDHAMAYDPVRQRVVMFGGTNGSELNDIWEWDGANWSLRASGVVGVGSNGAAAYDPLLGGVLYSRVNTNLLWNGAAASVLNVAQPAGGTTLSGPNQMVFSAVEGGCMQLQGQWTRVFRLPQGWEDVGLSTVFNIQGFAIASDPVQNRVFFQGGDGGVGSGSGLGMGHTWLWTGSLWSLVAGQQPLLSRHAMVFDHGRGCFVMFGGRMNGGGLSGVTYRWVDSSPAANYQTFGAGCAGTLPATPRLAADALWNTAPVLGGAFFALVDQLPPAVPVGGVIGYSNTAWSGSPLPLALDGLGMIGCNLLVRPDAIPGLGLSSPAGSASWVTFIPANPALSGVQFFQQAFAVVPGANPLGVVWSNGGWGTIGY